MEIDPFDVVWVIIGVGVTGLLVGALAYWIRQELRGNAHGRNGAQSNPPRDPAPSQSSAAQSTIHKPD